MQKFNFYTIFIALTFIIACVKPESPMDIMDKKSFCEENITSGTKIDKVRKFVLGDTGLINRYIYNNEGLLTSIKSSYWDFAIDTFIYDSQKRMNCKIHYTSYNKDGELDSLFYNKNSQLIMLKSYKLYDRSKKLEFGYINYYYNSFGQLERDSNNRQVIHSYSWNNDNISEIKLLSPTNEVLLVQKFSYDDKKNPFPKYVEKGLPYTRIYASHEFPTKNNVKTVENQSFFNGLPRTDTIKFDYCYNIEGYPYFIKSSRGDSTLIYYKF